MGDNFSLFYHYSRFSNDPGIRELVKPATDEQIDYDNVDFAVGFRKIAESYSGPIVRIRRESDDAEQDFFADITGEVTPAAVAGFTAGSRAFLVTMYDQGPNSNNVTQIDPGKQPFVADTDGKIVATSDGKMSALYEPGRTMETAGVIEADTGVVKSISVVGSKLTGSSSTDKMCGRDTFDNYDMTISDTDWTFFGGNQLITIPTGQWQPDAPAVFSVTPNALTTTVTVNGVIYPDFNTAAGWGSTVTDTVYKVAEDEDLNGFVSEIVMWNNSTLSNADFYPFHVGQQSAAGSGNYGSFNTGLAPGTVYATLNSGRTYEFMNLSDAFKGFIGKPGVTGSSVTDFPFTGKHYIEVTCLSGSTFDIGIADDVFDPQFQLGASTSVSYRSEGDLLDNGANNPYGASYGVNDVISILWDNGDLTFWLNGVSQGTAKSSIAGTWFVAVGTRAVGGSSEYILNWGQDAFTYSPPAGFSGVTGMVPAGFPTGGEAFGLFGTTGKYPRSNEDRQVTTDVGTWGRNLCDVELSGHMYMEFVIKAGQTQVNQIGVSQTAGISVDDPLGLGDAASYGYTDTGVVFFNGSSSSYGASFVVGDIIGMEWDNGDLIFYKNGVSQGVAASGLGAGFFAAIGDAGTTREARIELMNGEGTFNYTVPAGAQSYYGTPV